MASKGTLTVRLVGDSKPLEKTLKGVGGKLGGFIKGVAKAGAAASALVAFKGVQAAREAQKINRITENVIKTTGGAANVSAKQVDELSGRLQKLTGVSDETIQRGSNMLLTFTNIRNEVGKNNDIFDQATGMALDLSVAMGTDVKDSAIQLGKALNDPIKGVSALSRVGIQFTDVQKDQIATLMENNDILGAQKIILGELEKQFGGTAEAAADPMQKLQSVIGDVVEVVGTALLPVVDKVATWLADRLPAAVDRARELFSQLFNVLFRGDFTGGPFAEDSPFIASLFRVRDIVLDVGPKVVGKIRDVGQAVVKWWTDTAQPAIVTFAGEVQRFWRDTVQPVLRELQQAWRENGDEIGDIVTHLGEIVMSLGRIIGSVFRSAEQDVQAGTEGMSEDIGTAIGALEGLVSAIATLARWAERIMTPIKRVSEAFRDTVSPIGQAIKAFEVWGRVLDELRAALGRIPQQFRDIGDRFVQIGRDIVAGIVRGIREAPGAAVDAIRDVAGSILQGARNFIQSKSPSKLFALKVGQPISEGVAEGILDKLSSGMSAVDTLMGRLQDRAQSQVGNVFSGIRSTFGLQDAKDALKEARAELAQARRSGGDVAGGRRAVQEAQLRVIESKMAQIRAGQELAAQGPEGGRRFLEAARLAGVSGPQAKSLLRGGAGDAFSAAKNAPASVGGSQGVAKLVIDGRVFGEIVIDQLAKLRRTNGTAVSVI